MMPEFEFWRPQSLAGALRMMAEVAPQIHPISGGTNLVVDLRGGRQRPRVVLNLEGLSELKGIRREDGHVSVGGGISIAELLGSELVYAYAPSLRDAAGVFASPLVRNRASLAGNLVDASPAADTAPPLLALDAEVQLASQAGSRWVSLDEFFVGVRKTVLRPEELLVAVRWPVPADGTRFGYYKLGLRKADAISVVSAATAVEMDEKGVCVRARIALGSVAPRPVRTKAAEAALQGKPLSEETIRQAARLSAEAVQPISDLRASAWYRKQMVETLVARLLRQSMESTPRMEGKNGA